MERNELLLRERIERVLDVYSLDDIFDYNDVTIEDILVFLYFEYGLKFPDKEPL